MATQNFVGQASPDVTTSWTAYGYVESTSAANGIQLPTNGQIAFNNNKPIYVTTVRTFMAGRGGTRKMRVGIGGQYSSYKNVASASNASGSVDFTVNAIFQNGGNQNVKYDEDGTGGFYFGRDASIGGCTDGNTADFGGSLSGYATYYEVPNAPTLNTAAQDGVSQDVNLSWTAPTSNGGTAITGYIIDYSTSSGFASYTSITTGSTATTYKVTGLTYGQTYYFRIRALNATASAAGTSSIASSSLSVTVIVPGTDEWESFGTLPANNTVLFERNTVPGTTKIGLHRKITATATGGSYTSGNFGMRRVMGALATVDMPDLEIGRSYTVSGKAKLGTAGIQGNIYRFAVTGIGNGSTVTLTTTEATVPSYTFTATATSHTIEFELAESYTVSATGTIEDVYLYDFTLTRAATDLTTTKGYWIQDNKFSGSLADHYDLTMNSIGGYWWVDKENNTQFAQDTDYSINLGTFTDGKEYVGSPPVLTPGQSVAGELHYLDIEAGYDTSQVVNDIIITNEGLAPSGGSDSSLVAWQASYPLDDTTSKANWGTRRTELTTNLWLDSVDNLLQNPSCEVSTDTISNGAATVAAKKLRQITKGTSGLTSTTSNSIGTGTKTFAHTSSTFYAGAEGKRLRVWNTANSKNFVEGVITARTSTSVTISVDTYGGSGTFTAWTLGMVTSVLGENRCLMMKVTATTSAAIDPYWQSQDGEEILVEPGKAYIGIAYAARGVNPSDCQTSLGLRWYDDSGTFLSQASTAAATLTNQGQWYKFVAGGIAPDNANTIVPRMPFVRPGTGSFSSGQVMYADALLVAEAITVNTQTPTYSAPNITLTTAEPHGISVGESVTLVGFTPTGYNGTWTAQTGTTGSTLVLNIGSNPGAITVGGAATTVLDYFDGNTPDTPSYIYDWLGEPDFSPSRRSENRLYTRANDILTAFADPAVVVKSFTWNAAENTIVAGKLDIGSIISIKFNGVENTYRVAGLEHDITPEQWLIRVRVQKAS